MKTDKLKKAEPVEKKVEKVAAVESAAAEKVAEKPVMEQSVKVAVPAEEKAKVTRTRKTAAKTAAKAAETTVETKVEKAPVEKKAEVKMPVESKLAEAAPVEKKAAEVKAAVKEEAVAEVKAAAKEEPVVEVKLAAKEEPATEEKPAVKKTTRTRTAAKKAAAEKTETAEAKAEPKEAAKPAKRAAKTAQKASTEKKPVAEKKTRTTTARKAKKDDAFATRMAGRREQLQALYLQQFAGDEAGFAYLEGMLRTRWEERSEALRTLDAGRTANWYEKDAHLVLTMSAAAFAGTLNGVKDKLGYVRELGADFLRIQDLLEEVPGAGMSFSGLVRPQLGEDGDLAALSEACRKEGISLGADIAMDHTGNTHPWTSGDDGRYYQGSQVLNYGAAITFNDMASGMLRLANAGVEILFLNGLDRMGMAEHQSQVAVAQMLRLICEIVCPGVVLVGEGGNAFLGTEEVPGCHLVSGVDAVVWHTLAAGEVSLLRHSVENKDNRQVNSLLGCRGLRWDLDFDWLEQHGMNHNAHVRYLNDYYTGVFKGSDGRGILRDGALWGTAASLCGVEAADFEQNALKLEQSAARLNLLYGWLLTEGGIPAIQSGDEIGQLNDYNDHSDPYLTDAAVVCRGSFSWPLAEMRNDSEMRQGKHYLPLRHAVEAWSKEPAFRSGAKVWTEDTGNGQVLAVLRQVEGRTVAALFNFGGSFVTAGIDRDGAGVDLIYGVRHEDLRNVTLYPYSFAWLLLEEK